MKKADIKMGMEVAVVRSDNWGVQYGIVVDNNASKRVHHGSRDFIGSMSDGFIAVNIVRNGEFTNKTETVRPNQIKDANEVRMMQQAKQDRKDAKETMVAKQKSDAESAVEMLKAKGIDAQIKPVTYHGDWRINGWEVAIKAATALKLAGTYTVSRF